MVIAAPFALNKNRLYNGGLKLLTLLLSQNKVLPEHELHAVLRKRFYHEWLPSQVLLPIQHLIPLPEKSFFVRQN